MLRPTSAPGFAELSSSDIAVTRVETPSPALLTITFTHAAPGGPAHVAMVPPGPDPVEIPGKCARRAGLDAHRGRPTLAGMPRKPPRRWSQRVTRTSNALDLESGVFRM